MPSLPDAYEPKATLNARLVTKTSLPQTKQTLALLILLWLASNKPSALEYGATTNEETIFDPEISDRVFHLIENNSQASFKRVDFDKAIKENPLFVSQLESLNAAFELIWKLARFNFQDSSLNAAAERTGGERYPKVIHFSSNMDILDAIYSADRVTGTEVLTNWLLNQKSKTADNDVEKRLVKVLTALAETSFYKSARGADGVIYAPFNIYSPLANGREDEIQLGTGEKVGPTRVLNTLIGEGLNLYLRKSGQTVTIPDEMKEACKDYSARAETAVELSQLKLSVHETPENAADNPRNLIVSGAPGTGKSYSLDKRAKGSLFKNGANVVRVTFHPDYTYAQFVGTYKPLTEERKIYYSFIPGPFVDVYIDALKHPDDNYLLLIEEINRADVAATFGDVFQLLDRDETGASKYSIVPTPDLKKYLEDELSESAETETMQIPGNMYIWATMNSADQGVFPMDTAFKRRWNFEYMDINEGSEKIKDIGVQLTEKSKPIKWDELRRRINEVLLRDCMVNEDKLLGAFFLPLEVLNDSDSFRKSFKEKVLQYLCEDAAKMRKAQLFKGVDSESITYSSIRNDFDKMGEGIFGFSFAENGPAEGTETLSGD